MISEKTDRFVHDVADTGRRKSMSHFACRFCACMLEKYLK